MIKNPSQKQMNESLCHRCHWKDNEGYKCHAVELPKKIEVSIGKSDDCYYLPVSYWERIPEERKEKYREDVKERSKRYYG